MATTDRPTSALFTDLYELTMAQAYAAEGFTDTAVFETFFRKLPQERSYVVAAGLRDVVEFLDSFRFREDELDHLRGLGLFRDDFLALLRDLRFTGDVWAVPEGTIVFPNEPIVQVVAPILEAQLVETFVLNQVHLQSLVASKAARIVDAARGRTIVDFGSRRAHGIDAAMKVARASYLAGAAGTSNVLAGRAYGIPVFGTMAHSYVQAFDDETEAFEAFARVSPDTTILVDTYDTLAAVDRVVALARRLGDRFRVSAVRLDSGDIGALAAATRSKLDAAGLHDVRIVASSALDEYEIAALLDAGRPIDRFGVGTALAVSADAPALDMAYKLVAYAGRGRTKLSSAKVGYPGRKRISRRIEHGELAGDTVSRFDEEAPGDPLLVPVMRAGKPLRGSEGGLMEARRRLREQVAALPAHLRALHPAEPPYPVRVSETLRADLQKIRREHGA